MIQYQIMELDSEHLKKYDSLIKGVRDRICFIPAKFSGWAYYIQDSFEDAVKVIEEHGDDFKEYTIIPRIYKTNF